MASQWALVDDQFPHFQGDESVPEQIRALVNYMFVLAEQLRYMLSNLKAENWNEASLQAFSQETTDAAAKTVEEQLKAVSAQVETLGRQLSILASAHTQDVQKLEEQDAYFERTLGQQSGQITDLQEHVSEIQASQNQQAEELEEVFTQLGDTQAGLDEEVQAREALQEQVAGEEGLVVQMAALTAQLEILNKILILQKEQEGEEEKNTVILGAEGMDVRIVGKAIYFNEELIGGEADETA